jgi:peptidoglycan hydrolase-like protein with peptidoglycan-binding domain
VINASMLVSFGGPAHATMPGQPLPAGPRLLMLKSAMMSGDDVRAVQQALNKHDSAGPDPDGIYGPATRDAALSRQRREHIAVDGIIGRKPGPHWTCRHKWFVGTAGQERPGPLSRQSWTLQGRWLVRGARRVMQLQAAANAAH